MSGDAQNCTRWRWTKPREDAARLLAEDELTDQEIADTLKVSRRVLADWKNVPAFAARLAENVAALAAAGLRHAITRKNRRLRSYDERWRKLQQVFDERGADPAMQQVPGGKTGLLVRTVKGIGGGDNWQQVDEYAVDTAALREVRELERQAAQEAGQWVERQEHGGKVEIVGAALGPGQSLDDLR